MPAIVLRCIQRRIWSQLTTWNISKQYTNLGDDIMDLYNVTPEEKLDQTEAIAQQTLEGNVTFELIDVDPIFLEDIDVRAESDEREIKTV